MSIVTMRKPYRKRLKRLCVRTSIHAVIAVSTTMMSTDTSVTTKVFLNAPRKFILLMAAA